MKRQETVRRETLAELREDFNLCGKCRLCTAVMAQRCEDARFWRNCPSGTRYRFEPYYASGKLEIARSLDLNEIAPDETMAHAVFSCMLCGTCEDRCYPFKQLHPGWILQLLREQAVDDGWAPLENYKAMLEGLEKEDNAYGVSAAKRNEWAKGLKIKDALQEKCEYLLFVGDDYGAHASLASRMKDIANVLTKAGVDFGTLGTAELSSGKAALEIGDRDFFETFVNANIELFKKAGITKVVTGDAHAASALRLEYTKWMPELEVFHISELLAELIADGKLKPTKEVKAKVAYHDPCKLVRMSIDIDVSQGAREVLAAIPGLEVVPFPRDWKDSLCCGGGGGVQFWDTDFVRYTTNERLFEAEYVGADAIVTSCPICIRMFEDAIADKKSSMKVYDLAEILEKAL